MIKRYILNWLLKHLYKAVVLEDILTFQKEQNGKTKLLFLNGEQLAIAEIRNLKAEARLIKGMRLWKIIDETLEDHAKQMMFKNSKSWEEMSFGKAILYNKSIERNIIEIFENIDAVR